MACRNCGRSDLPLYDVTLVGEEPVEVTLCARCHREYQDLGWIDDAIERGE